MSSTSFYLFDEASAIADRIFEVAEGGLTDGEPMIFLFGNPTRNTGKFYRCSYGSEQDRWKVRSIDSRTCSLPNQTQIAEWLQDYGEDFRLLSSPRPRAATTRERASVYRPGPHQSGATARHPVIESKADMVKRGRRRRAGVDLCAARRATGNHSALPATGVRPLDGLSFGLPSTAFLAAAHRFR